MDHLTIIGAATVCKQHGFGRETHRKRIKSGEFVPPLPAESQTAPRRFLKSESDAIALARIRGASRDEIRELVKRLVADRAKLGA